MHVTEDTIPRRLRATNKMCLYFIIAALVALLVFTLATIMVLVIQRTVCGEKINKTVITDTQIKHYLHEFCLQDTVFCYSVALDKDNIVLLRAEASLQLKKKDHVRLLILPQRVLQNLSGQDTCKVSGHRAVERGPTETAAATLTVLVYVNTSEDYLRILHSTPFNTATAYMRVSNPVNSSKLSLIEKGICEDIQCKSEELVIEKQGLYLIYCHLNFYFANCSNNAMDLKIELLVNDKINRQTLSTWCASDTCREKSFKTLFLLHLTHLNMKDRISMEKIMTKQY